MGRPIIGRSWSINDYRPNSSRKETPPPIVTLLMLAILPDLPGRSLDNLKVGIYLTYDMRTR